MYEKDHEAKLLATSTLFYLVAFLQELSWKMKISVEGKKHGINSSPVLHRSSGGGVGGGRLEVGTPSWSTQDGCRIW